MNKNKQSIENRFIVVKGDSDEGVLHSLSDAKSMAKEMLLNGDAHSIFIAEVIHVVDFGSPKIRALREYDQYA